MKKIGIFFGSATGTAEDLANRIAGKLGVDAADVHNVANASAATAGDYEVLLLGSSTWGYGELQDDWFDFLNDLKGHVSGKKVGLFGCGDSSAYDDTFCDAVGIIYEELSGCGCTFIGAYTPEEYSYNESKAEVDGKLVGLCCDEVNEDDKTDDRMSTWIAALGL
ncbi:flavodoxin [Porphyromonas sp.]|uniref:flavodoxin n=1 Tax=Porphyromonas sp. TaxID=1924944 RepID=UPI0026DB14D5|nr:flavodoxin [Porphyromonas sp.]MDO4695333.1 flavodoxin [Porphyromonas sp.]MDO4771093.1 flavodoxin [Porphyromonas sp.]